MSEDQIRKDMRVWVNAIREDESLTREKFEAWMHEDNQRLKLLSGGDITEICDRLFGEKYAS